MKQKFIAALYFVFAAFTTNAMAQTPPPGTIPLATQKIPSFATGDLFLDGNRLAAEQDFVQMFEKRTTGWVSVGFLNSFSSFAPLGTMIAFEGNLFAVAMDKPDPLSGVISNGRSVFRNTATGWQFQSFLINQPDLVCAGFNPDGITSLVKESEGPPDVMSSDVLRVYTCQNKVPKVTATIKVASPVPHFLVSWVLNRDTLVTGFVNANFNYHAYVFERTRSAAGAIWNFRGELPIPLSVTPQFLSPILAVDGNTAVVGLPEDNGGAAYVFERTSTTWVFKAKLSQPSSTRRFGTSIAISGDRLLVGTDRFRATAGEAYLFQRVNGSWSTFPNLLKPAPSNLDVTFGHRVALQGNTAIVSSVFENALYAYSLPNIVPTAVSNEIVLDNLAAGLKETVGVGTVPGWRTFTGTWCNSIAADFFGTKSLYSCAGTADSYRWTPNIKTAGKYDVYIWYATNANRSTSVPITVASTTTPVTKIYNERAGGGRWILHGRYTFAAGRTGYVEVRAANGQAGADAVRLVSVP